MESVKEQKAEIKIEDKIGEAKIWKGLRQGCKKVTEEMNEMRSGMVKMVIENEYEETNSDEVNYRQEYRKLKRKLKLLIYENECFQESLRNTERKFLSATRDRNFLLERLSTYEPIDTSTSDTEETAESSDDEYLRTSVKRRKFDGSCSFRGSGVSTPPGNSKSGTPVRKKKAGPAVNKSGACKLTTSVPAMMSQRSINHDIINGNGEGCMTPEEVERHLEAKKRQVSLTPEKTSLTLPSEMFSSDITLDRKPDLYVIEHPSITHRFEFAAYVFCSCNFCVKA
ncbi:hypothetical protein PGB90_003939 [Kerria lacca]